MEKTYFAAIDLGSNACRIMIADACANVVYRHSDTVKLGEGVKQNQAFSAPAMERTLVSVKNYQAELAKYGVKQLRAITTEAARIASNGADFLQQIYQKTGIKFEVISPFEEARLTLKGAISHIKNQSKYALVFDLGGGSTEITLAENTDNAKILYSLSIPWGSRNSAEFFKLEEYDAHNAKKLSDEITGYINKFITKSNYAAYKDDVKAVSTSSTPLRLAAIINNFSTFDRLRADGITMNIPDLDKTISAVCQMPVESRIKNPCIGANRGPIFISACIIFKTIYDALNLTSITASLKAALDAIIEELISSSLSSPRLVSTGTDTSGISKPIFAKQKCKKE